MHICAHRLYDVVPSAWYRHAFLCFDVVLLQYVLVYARGTSFFSFFSFIRLLLVQSYRALVFMPYKNVVIGIVKNSDEEKNAENGEPEKAFVYNVNALKMFYYIQKEKEFVYCIWNCICIAMYRFDSISFWLHQMLRLNGAHALYFR